MNYEAQNAGVLSEIRRGGRVALIRLRSLGDCVLTTPAIEILKSARPDLRIGVVVEDRFAAVFAGNPAVSAILAPAYGAMWRWHPDLALNLHGGTRSQLLTLASRARWRAGFAHHRGSGLYDVKIPRAQEILGVERTVHTAEHLASAAFYLGAAAGEIPRARLYAQPARWERPYAVIHATAAAAYKTWHAAGFLAVAEHVERTRRLEPVFIGAATDDLTPFARYRRIAGQPLEYVKSLLAGASLFVGNDSGPAHMACAFGVPLLVLYGRVEHRTIWAPWRAVAARTLVAEGGIGAIGIEEAIAALDDLP
jgi:heptosyltransferase III